MTDLLARTIDAIGPLDAAAMRAAEERQSSSPNRPNRWAGWRALSIRLAGIQGRPPPVIATRPWP